jgi:hypothetical protein
MIDAIRNLPPLPSENQLVAYLGPPVSTALEVDSMMGLQKWICFWDEQQKRSYVFLISLNPDQSVFKVATHLNTYDGPLIDPKDPGANSGKGLQVPEWIEAMSLLQPPKFKDGTPGPCHAWLAVRHEPWKQGLGRSDFQDRLMKLPKFAKSNQVDLVLGKPERSTKASWFAAGTSVLRRMEQFKGLDEVYVIEYERDPKSPHYHEVTSAFVTPDFLPDGTTEPPTITDTFDVQLP